ncbi:MAG: sigma-70 family RNA polymerase sigma factor [Sedimentisphaerales bacterium]|nr:sigma-70 family RNA polymerase sigma factor [Sedimentisphaerales bacterium]
MLNTAGEIELLRAAIAGDKGAFRPIIERYQALVCSITYSATGDFALSRHLARQTFAKAFRSLPQLKEIEAFRPYLTRIARNLIDKAVRKQRFDVIRDEDQPAGTCESQPDGIPVSAERQALVWQSLESIPPQYRDAMVFYYHHDPAVPALAADFDVSEPVLIQRASKARTLLKVEVSAFVQEVLAKAAPAEDFTLSAMNELLKPPIGPPSRGAAADQNESARTTEQQHAAQQMSPAAIAAAFGGGIFGGVAWILSTALTAKDWDAATATLAAAAVIFVIATALCIRNQGKRWKILGWVVAALCVLNLAVLNLRWKTWKQAVTNIPGFHPATDMPLWKVNLVIVAIMAVLLIITLVRNARENKQTTANR